MLNDHPTPIPELAGATVKRAQLYGDILLIELSDGKTAFEVHQDGGELRVHVVSKAIEGARPGVRVYRSDVLRGSVPGQE